MFIILNETDASNIQTHECRRTSLLLGHWIISLLFLLLLKKKMFEICCSIIRTICQIHYYFFFIFFYLRHLFLAPCYDCEALCWFLTYIFIQEKQKRIMWYLLRCASPINLPSSVKKEWEPKWITWRVGNVFVHFLCLFLHRSPECVHAFA